ncbi:N utilization substance protein B [Methylohalomonas lacus]|uniref:Transcription antitermination protein NusB n=1 Tax=Methylohalomonas lacus TaxID=398773 RepID=A0AAE3L4X3_9GAMM|nr:transcription antitermination factor NusB [Methylohalomonas lacus]MCS3902307.1 N utilization substance protein B [Methylohalomonas lacus]
MSLIPAPFSRRARERARRTALQALYEVRLSAKSVAEILNRYVDDPALKRADKNYFRTLVKGACEQHSELDEQIEPLLDRPLKEIDPVEQAILHIAVYELLYETDMPPRAIINEAVELAKMFGAEESHKYINSVLDKAARRIRFEQFGVKQ